MRIIFMGTPGFALHALEALHKAGHEIVAIYTQPPRPAGRGQKDQPSPVHLYAKKHGLPAFTPTSLKEPHTLEQLRERRADVTVVAAYGLLLPKAVLHATKFGCINIHPSALPRWRGAAPINRTLMAGDTQTAVCIMQMDEGLDTGDILASEPFYIPPGMTAGELHDALAQRGAKLTLEVLEQLARGTATRTPQASAGITYAHKITKEECRIDWSKSAEELVHHIRGLSPTPGAFALLEETPFKIFAAEALPYDGSGAPGTVTNRHLVIACGKGALKPLVVQKPGKKRMNTEEMLAGKPIPYGTLFT